MTILRKALFLDRDGVINEDREYIHKPEQVVFIDGIFELCRRAHAADYLLIVVTNQSGIGRGYYTEDDFHALTDWMKARFEQEGAPLTHVYFCPHHPEHGIGHYKQDHPDRKPRPGMILRAQREYDIDLKHSILIGDKESDMQAGYNAGVGKLRLFTRETSPIYETIMSLHMVIPLLIA